jgi:hypothetical protein
MKLRTTGSDPNVLELLANPSTYLISGVRGATLVATSLLFSSKVVKRKISEKSLHTRLKRTLVCCGVLRPRAEVIG